MAAPKQGVFPILADGNVVRRLRIHLGMSEEVLFLNFAGGWTIHDILSVSESVFGCLMLFSAVSIVGCRDLPIKEKVKVVHDLSTLAA